MTNNTPSGAKKRHESTKPESRQTAKIFRRSRRRRRSRWRRRGKEKQFGKFLVQYFYDAFHATRHVIAHENTQKWMVCCHESFKVYPHFCIIIYCMSALFLHIIESVNCMWKQAFYSYTLAPKLWEIYSWPTATGFSAYNS